MGKRGRGADIPLEQAIENLRPIANSIWANLAQVETEGATTRILFVGGEERSGTTVIAAATALGLARNLRVNVTLVETHLESPALAAYMGLPLAPGLSEVLESRASLEESRRDVESCPGLSVVAAGRRRAPIPGEFASEVGRVVLRDITNSGGFVIMDAPPIEGHPETRVLLDYVDGVVIVLRARSTRRDAIEKTMAILEESGVPVLGSVLNRFKSDLPFGFGAGDR